ncbi:MAG TPA: hypothetical protein VLI94_10525 [Solirubrobacterales bacterium]|nr:hypothetical protein [Solirubrobacterales bacterium]
MQREGEGTTPGENQDEDETDCRQSQEALNEPAEQDAQGGPSDQGDDGADSGREQLHPVLLSLHLFHYRNFLSATLLPPCPSCLKALKLIVF